MDPSPATGRELSAVCFRGGAVADVPTIVALVESAYRGDESRRGWTTEADLLGGQRTDAAEIGGVIASPGAVIVMAELDGRCVGCCKVETDPPRRASFGLFAVQPALQGRGLGRAVVGEAERIALEMGARTMSMTVISQRTELIAFYARLGYLPTGATAPFPYGNERAGIPRRNDLEFIVLEKVLRSPL